MKGEDNKMKIEVNNHTTLKRKGKKERRFKSHLEEQLPTTPASFELIFQFEDEEMINTKENPLLLDERMRKWNGKKALFVASNTLTAERVSSAPLRFRTQKQVRYAHMIHLQTERRSEKEREGGNYTLTKEL